MIPKSGDELFRLISNSFLIKMHPHAFTYNAMSFGPLLNYQVDLELLMIFLHHVITYIYQFSF